jgi:hypothetical protein
MDWNSTNNDQEHSMKGEKKMPTYKTGTREQWLAERLELLKAEKELTRRSDELARLRQDLPWVRIDKQYRFDTDEGNASLADLFIGLKQEAHLRAASNTCSSGPRPAQHEASLPSITTAGTLRTP